MVTHFYNRFYIFSIIDQVKNMDTATLTAELERQANVLLPRFEDHLSTVAENISPVLQKELEFQSRALAPKLERLLEKENIKLKKKLEEDFERELVLAIQQIENRQRSVLVEQIPELRDDYKAQDRVLESIRISLIKWSMRQLTHTFHQHVMAMEEIRKTLQKSYLARDSEGKNVKPDDVILIWLELMNENIGGDETILSGKGLPENRPGNQNSKQKGGNK